MRKVCTLLALWPILAGCTTSSLSATSTMLSENTAVVSLVGTKPADRDKVYAAALAQAARLARARGYQYFTILKADDRSVTLAKNTAGEGIPYLFGARNTSRGFGATSLSPTHLVGTTYMTPGKSVSYLKPGLELTVQMYHQGEIDPSRGGVWNIDFIPDQAGIEP